MGNIGAIIKGHIKELFDKNKSLRDNRFEICLNCPLCVDSKIGYICHPSWYNKDTGHVSLVEIEGYAKGCSCRLEAKTREENEECPAGKW